jgi:hypothetical protein
MSQVNFTTGNFELVIKGTLKPDQQEKANDAAIRWITQRDVASDVYKQLRGVKNSKGNLQLPEGFERSSVEFSADDAELLRVAAVEKLSKYLDGVEVTVSRHVAGETAAPRAMATAMWAQLSDAQKVALGIAADASEADGIEACHKFLAGFRKSKGG